MSLTPYDLVPNPAMSYSHPMQAGFLTGHGPSPRTHLQRTPGRAPGDSAARAEGQETLLAVLVVVVAVHHLDDSLLVVVLVVVIVLRAPSGLLAHPPETPPPSARALLVFILLAQQQQHRRRDGPGARDSRGGRPGWSAWPGGAPACLPPGCSLPSAPSLCCGSSRCRWKARRPRLRGYGGLGVGVSEPCAATSSAAAALEPQAELRPMRPAAGPAPLRPTAAARARAVGAAATAPARRPPRSPRPRVGKTRTGLLPDPCFPDPGLTRGRADAGCLPQPEPATPCGRRTAHFAVAWVVSQNTKVEAYPGISCI
ncbi:uncharacterized protein AAES06_020524 [Glossophaga mutica]